MQRSALEGGRNNMMGTGIALGIITAVDPKKRFCEVKTFMAEEGFEDLHLPQVQWLSTDSNPDGDESTSIPRVGSTGLVFFVAGEPFIWGYFKATDPIKGAVTGKEPSNLNEGDKVISTVGGNRFVVKANGSIEIHSKDTLKTVYFPKDGLLANICRAYSLESDAFDEKAKITNFLTQQTLHTAEYRQNMARTCIVVEERGSVTPTIVRKVAIGPGIPAIKGVKVPVFEYTTDMLGETNVNVGVLGTGVSFKVTPLGECSMKNLTASVNMSPTGDWSFKNLLASIDMKATGQIVAKGPVAQADMSATGDITVKNKLATVNIKTTGAVEVTAPGGKITISVAGEVSINANAKVKIDAKAGIDVNSLGPVNVSSLGKVSIKGITIGLDGGTGPTNNVLCFPMTVSQFTGSPLMPYSQTVKCSS